MPDAERVMEDGKMHHDYYSPKEAADYLGLAPLTLANWRSRGIGPAFLKLGEERTDRIIYRRRDLELWKQARDRRIEAAARAQERADARKDKDTPKPRRLRLDGLPDRRQGWPSTASRNPISVEG